MTTRTTILSYIAAGSVVLAGTVAPVTDRLITFTSEFEGYFYVPYADPAYPDDESLLTVCAGITNRALPGFVIKGKRYSEEECDKAEAKVLMQFSKEITPLIKVDMTQGQRETLVDFAYNVGTSNLRLSNLLIKINKNDCFGASLEFDKWVRANKKVMRGLVRRRDAEQYNFGKWCTVDGKFPDRYTTDGVLSAKGFKYGT